MRKKGRDANYPPPRPKRGEGSTKRMEGSPVLPPVTAKGGRGGDLFAKRRRTKSQKGKIALYF